MMYDINGLSDYYDPDNIGVIDTAIRSVIAVVLITLAIEGFLSTAMTVAFVVIGAMLWISSATGVCLIYKMFGIDTYHSNCEAPKED